MGKITLSVIKADVGGYVGHSAMHPDLPAKADEMLGKAKKDGLLIDYSIISCGDDLDLVMTHTKGEDNEEIHGLCWNVFEACTDVAKKLHLYGAGQDLLADAFSGNVKGMGPGVAEAVFEERKSEPVLVFAADKCAPGAWNLPLYRMFADPFNTAGLVIDPNMHDGFWFEVFDIHNERRIFFDSPKEMYDILVFVGSPDHFLIKAVYRKNEDGSRGEICASSSTQKLALIAGKYVGKDDPVMIVRSQSGLPAVGEVLEPFAFSHTTSGFMRGSHMGPLMPVSFEDATPSRFDGPPRVICAGYQLADGKFVGPRDMFADISFDNSRQMALDVADYLRRHGPFEPHRLPYVEMEYTTMPTVEKKLQDRWEKL
jgi:fructose 1,6-bisphosphate aldolase/phosphatase